ncbi:MAG: GntR family transcriptional regulator [Solirubrobacterales bacterium]
MNRHSALPLYRQVASAIEVEISSGPLQPDERLPGEAELAERYEVNRLTVRSALAELAQRGLIYTVHGRGSYVSAPAIRHDISGDREASLTRAMRESGHLASQRLLSAADEERSDVARTLGTRGRVRRYELLRYVDESPWTLTTTWLPEHRFRHLGRHWRGDDSLYEVLEREYGARMRRAYRTISTEASGPTDAEHLMVPVGFPLLVIGGLNVDERGKPVVLVEHRGRGDRVQFTVRFE